MLEPKRTARLLGILILAQGATLLCFYKVLSFALETGLKRYGSATGRLASALFSEDKGLVELLRFGEQYIPLLLVASLAVLLLGLAMTALPAQAAQLMLALRVLKKDSHG